MYYLVNRRKAERIGILGASGTTIRGKSMFCGAARALSCFFVSFLLALPSLQAQTSQSNQALAKDSGGVAGTIKDPQHAAVAGALVKLTDPSTNRVSTATTGQNGAYRFSSIPAAAYDLEVNVKGFKPARIQGIKVAADVIAIQDVVLSIGEPSETIQVTSEEKSEILSMPTLAAIPESVMIDAVVVTRDDIQALHPTSVMDVLQQVPGMEVTFQGRQHMDFGNMRGAGSYRTILDGIYLSQSDRLLASIPAETIESITIVRDATALAIGPLTSFGSATGASNQGFIVIKTKRPEFQIKNTHYIFSEHLIHKTA